MPDQVRTRYHDTRSALRRLVKVTLEHSRILQRNTDAQEKACAALEKHWQKLCEIELILRAKNLQADIHDQLLDEPPKISINLTRNPL